jgi:hypothetical protein
MERLEMPPIARPLPTIPVSNDSWTKSSHSNPSGDCVELRVLPDGGIAIRHSQHPDGPILIVARAAMVAAIEGVKYGKADG